MTKIANKTLKISFVVTVILLMGLMSVESANAVSYSREDIIIFDMATGATQDPESNNPYVAGMNWGRGVTPYCIEYLFYFDPSNGTYIPWLATGITSSSDLKTWTITLRQGVTWSDGEPFTATDVAFTFNMLLETHTPPLYWESEVQANVQSIDIIDDYTVKFNLKSATHVSIQVV